MTEIDPAVGTYIRNLRIQAGISLRTAAHQMGVSHVFLGEVERGKRMLPRKHWARLAEVVRGVALDELESLSAPTASMQLSLRAAGPSYEQLGTLLLRRARKQDLGEGEFAKLFDLLNGGSE